MKKLSFFRRIRTYTAALSLPILNLNVFGKSFKGICSPGFNCHGCPWASFACPIGVFSFGSAVRRLPLLALTSILMIVIVLGRLVCGFFCPFGFFQDVLNKIPLPKFKLPKWLNWVKYAALLLLVFLLPYLVGFHPGAFLKLEKPGIDKDNQEGISVTVTAENISNKAVANPEVEVRYVEKKTQQEIYKTQRTFDGVTIPPGEKVVLPRFSIPNYLGNADLFVTSPQSSISQSVPYDLYFCKICPAGALTASLPAKWGAKSQESYTGAGWFSLKFIILYVFLILMLFSRRPFCRILCPLGALYGLTAKLSVVTMTVDKKACIDCGACDKVCPVELDVVKEVGGAECIACGDCVKVCPVNCIHRSILPGKQSEPAAAGT